MRYNEDGMSLREIIMKWFEYEYEMGIRYGWDMLTNGILIWMIYCHAHAKHKHHTKHKFKHIKLSSLQEDKGEWNDHTNFVDLDINLIHT